VSRIGRLRLLPLRPDDRARPAMTWPVIAMGTPRSTIGDMTTPARAYGVALLQDVRMGPPIVEYLERIDATLAPYGGRFIVHSATPAVLEGVSPGTMVVIEFPDRDHALEWYDSPAYQAILPLRTENTTSTVFIVDGVGTDHRATDVLR
jgi:uncharacterized protein (DUF1330 family)